MYSISTVQFKKSPYLENPERLADVIAAIQALGAYKFYKLDFAGWADRISGDKSKADYWKVVFEEHPEFFRLDSKKQRVSLVWRRQHTKRYDVDTRKSISKEEFYSRDQKGKDRISRIPLKSDEISILVHTAVELHSRAIEGKREKRWLLTASIGLLGVILGALVAKW